MRTLLAGELDTAKLPDAESDTYLKFEAQNADGTWVDISALLSKHWIVRATWGETVENRVSAATFTILQRDSAGNSLAPLMSGSPLNVDDLAAYAPALNIGRLVRASTAKMERGVPLDTDDLRQTFAGRIDDVLTTDPEPGVPAMMSLPCSDMGSWLMDMQIEIGEKTYGDPDSPPALLTVLQEIVDDNIPAGEPAVTVVKTSTSNFAVERFDAPENKVMEVLGSIVLESVGEDIRYRYASDHVSKLTWHNPDRDRATVDATFGVGEYVMHKLDLSIADIRNAAEMGWSGGTVTAENEASIALYRRRWSRLPSNSLVTTEVEAQAIVDAYVNDLGSSPAEVMVELPYFWPVQLWDRFTFTAPNAHYDEDQTFAVTGYQHTLENGKGSTVLTLSGSVVGAYEAWQGKQGDTPLILETTLTECPANNIVATLDFNDAAVDWKLWARKGSSPKVNGVPQAEYLRQPGRKGQELLRIKWWAEGDGDDTDDRWYIVVRAYNEASQYVELETSILVTGVSDCDELPPDPQAPPPETGQPPTLAPQFFGIESGNHMPLLARAYWNNTDSSLAIRIEWTDLDGPTVTEHELTPGTISHTKAFDAWDTVEVRGQYYNGDGDGPWSDVASGLVWSGVFGEEPV